MVAGRHPNPTITTALAYARANGWVVVKATGGSAHAWGIMRCPGDCPQVSISSTPKVPENHARALRRAVDRCPTTRNPTMPDYRFDLTIDGALTDSRLDALVDAGCDDATFSTKDNLTFAAFDRQAPTLREAVTSAIAAVDCVEGLRVRRVDPDELVWAAEIAERTGRTRASVDLLIKGRRGPGDFPPPANHATRNPLWRWADIENWFALYEGRQVDAETSAVICAINGVLEARHGLANSRHADQLRQALQQLLTT